MGVDADKFIKGLVELLPSSPLYLYEIEGKGTSQSDQGWYLTSVGSQGLT